MTVHGSLASPHDSATGTNISQHGFVQLTRLFLQLNKKNFRNSSVSTKIVQIHHTTNSGILKQSLISLQTECRRAEGFKLHPEDSNSTSPTDKSPCASTQRCPCGSPPSLLDSGKGLLTKALPSLHSPSFVLYWDQ